MKIWKRKNLLIKIYSKMESLDDFISEKVYQNDKESYKTASTSAEE